MIIKKISLSNIRSYESGEIVFPDGSTMLSGDIGSGKTSVLLAVEFVLFGLQPGQKGSSLLKNGKDSGSVAIEIEIDGKTIKLERGLKRGKSVNQSHANIEIDGREEELSVTELKNRVLGLLDYPKEFAKKTNLLYRYTVYTPQEEMKQIILEAPEIRLNTLRHVFGIDKYKRIKENTELLAAKLREKIKNYEGQIKDLEDLKKKLGEKKASSKIFEENIKILNQELSEKKDSRIASEKNLSGIEGKIKEKEKFEKEAEKAGIMVFGKKELLGSIEQEKKILLRQLEEARKITFSQEDFSRLEEEIKTHEKAQEEKNKNYLDLLSMAKSVSSKIFDMEKMKSQVSALKLCPTCFQDVNDSYKKNITRKFEDDLVVCRRELADSEAGKAERAKELESLGKSISILKKQLDELKIAKIKLDSSKEKEARIAELEKQNSFAEKDIILLSKQVEILRESASLLKKYDSLYEERKKELDFCLKKEKEKEIELAGREKEKEMTLKIIEEIEQEINEKQAVKKKLAEISELEDWLSNNFLLMISFTERNIMLKLKEQFSKLFNEWFNILVPEIFSVHLDEDFTPVIEQQDFSLDYSFLSGGERTAVALAYRLALNQVLNSLLSKIKTKDLVILDEPTDGFSEQQLDKMRDVLNQLKVRQLIIVSHESKIESFVENIIKFRKEAGITKVEN